MGVDIYQPSVHITILPLSVYHSTDLEDVAFRALRETINCCALQLSLVVVVVVAFCLFSYCFLFLLFSLARKN